jgi:hypothetical protein
MRQQLVGRVSLGELHGLELKRGLVAVTALVGSGAWDPSGKARQRRPLSATAGVDDVDVISAEPVVLALHLNQHIEFAHH